jgi:hypothetical protein
VGVENVDSLPLSNVRKDSICFVAYLKQIVGYLSFMQKIRVYWFIKDV